MSCQNCENEKCMCDNNELVSINNNTIIETKINYKKINPLAQEPTCGSKYAAGYDLYAAIEENTIIPAHTTIKIGTGLAFELPNYTFAAIFARSGLATKQGLRPANCVGR